MQESNKESSSSALSSLELGLAQLSVESSDCPVVGESPVCSPVQFMRPSVKKIQSLAQDGKRVSESNTTPKDWSALVQRTDEVESIQLGTLRQERLHIERIKDVDLDVEVYLPTKFNVQGRRNSAARKSLFPSKSPRNSLHNSYPRKRLSEKRFSGVTCAATIGKYEKTKARSISDLESLKTNASDSPLTVVVDDEDSHKDLDTLLDEYEAVFGNL